MTPNFALDFRNDQITLLHAQGGNWVQVGKVGVDDPDLDAAIGYLRSTALGLAPRGIMSVLILPDEAVLYTTLTDLPQTGRAEAIAAALVGRTPYDVADLVYDWQDDGASAHLAVIARETLDEAEGFAIQHRFNAVEFGAWPRQGAFVGAASFGAAASGVMIASGAPEAGDAMDAPAANARDFEMGAAQGQPEDAVISADLAAEDDAEMVYESVKDEDWAALDAPSADDLADMAALDGASTPMAQDAPRDDAAPSQPDQPGPQADMDAKADLFDQPAPNDAPEFVLGAQNDAPMDDLFAAPTSFEAAMDEVALDEAAMDQGATDEAAVDQGATDEAALDQPGHDAAQPYDTADGPLHDAPDNAGPAIAPAAAPADHIADDAQAPMAVDVPLDDPLPEAPPAPAGSSANKAESLLAAFAARREAALGKGDANIPAPRIDPKITNAAPALAVVPTRDLPAKLAPVMQNGLGTRPPLGAPQKSSNRSVYLGFVLTVALLIALAAAAAMSTYLTTAWNDFIAKPPQSDVAVVAPQDTPNAADQVAAELILAQPDLDDLSAPKSLADPAAAPALTLASRNAAVPQVQIPTALTPPAATPPPIISTASPQAPPVIPTKDGVLTPDGVFLIAGRPPVTPSARPEAVLIAAVQSAPNLIAADPALLGKKPIQRPATITPDALIPDALTPDVLAGDPALAGKRPTPRPETMMAAGREARLATASASLAQIPTTDLAPTVVEPDAPRSALAVTISRLPQARPNGLRAAPEPPAPDVQVAAAPTIQPDAPIEADNEPEVVASKSSGPRTVVSKNATYRDALNLSQPNLIGVYGSKANRYALVRLSTGRFKRLKVGDRFDGGTVAAITDSELRIAKRGQMIALKMPKG